MATVPLHTQGQQDDHCWYQYVLHRRFRHRQSSPVPGNISSHAPGLSVLAT
jgi:hypothetical protein